MNVFAKALELQPRLYMLVGLPGAGKSTWVERFRQKGGRLAGLHDAKVRDFVLIGHDTMVEELARRDGTDYNTAHSVHNFVTIRTENMRRLNAAVRDGIDIVHDETNMSPARRKIVLSRIPPTYYKIAVVFVIPDNILKQRLADREQKVGKHIDWSVVEQKAARYVAPTKADFNKIVYVRK